MAAGEWPFVGRLEELDFIDAAGQNPDIAGVVLAGAAGVGKTRLALEFQQRAAFDGFVVERAVATKAAATIPFGALAHLLPDIGPGATTQLDVLRRAGRALVERAGGRPLLLVVDDAHLLDDASAALVHQLASMRTAFVVLTVRTGESAPDSIVTMWKDRLAPRLEVQALARREVYDLVAGVLGGPVDDAMLHRLWEVTRGNGLFLRELVGAALEKGTLVQDDGRWRWTGTFTTSTALADVIEDRLRDISPDEREAMEMLALSGPLEATLLEAVASRSVIVGLERRALVVAHRDQHRVIVQLAHPLYGEVLAASAPVLRARHLRLQLADALGQTPLRRHDDVVRLATWRLDAGQEVDADLLLSAARRLMAVFDHTWVERLARAAVAADGGPEAAQLLGLELFLQGRFEEGHAVFERFQLPTRRPEWAASVAGQAEILFFGLGEDRRAIQLVAEAEPLAEQPEWRDELAALRAQFLYFSGHPDDALDLALPLVERADLPARAFVRVATVVGLWWSEDARFDEAIALLDRALAAAAGIAQQVPHAPIAVQAARHLALTRSGELFRAEAETERLHAAAVAERIDMLQSLWGFLMGRTVLERGRAGTALRLLEDAETVARRSLTAPLVPQCLIHRAKAAALRGAGDLARRLLDEGAATSVGSRAIYAMHADLERPWVLAAEGKVEEAAALAAAGARRFREMGRRGLEAVAAHDAVRLGSFDDLVDRLADLAASTGAPIVTLYADHAAARRADDGEALDAASARFEAMGADLLAAEAAAGAAAAHRRAGRAAAAAMARARAQLIGQRCEGARTPGLAVDEPSDPLTAREREVAALAAQGMSNPEIAARLYLSARTVASHLYNAYGKLGVNDRAQLAGVLAVDAAPG